jgi:hypothetical protein
VTIEQRTWNLYSIGAVGASVGAGVGVCVRASEGVGAFVGDRVGR